MKTIFALCLILILFSCKTDKISSNIYPDITRISSLRTDMSFDEANKTLGILPHDILMSDGKLVGYIYYYSTKKLSAKKNVKDTTGILIIQFEDNKLKRILSDASDRYQGKRLLY